MAGAIFSSIGLENYNFHTVNFFSKLDCKEKPQFLPRSYYELSVLPYIMHALNYYP